MKKRFKIDGIDCANCAVKLEDRINKLDKVNEATINFMLSKMTIDIDCLTEKEFENIMMEIRKLVKKIEPDAVIS